MPESDYIELNCFALVGPSVPVMSIAFGVAAGWSARPGSDSYLMICSFREAAFEPDSRRYRYAPLGRPGF